MTGVHLGIPFRKESPFTGNSYYAMVRLEKALAKQAQKAEKLHQMPGYEEPVPPGKMITSSDWTEDPLCYKVFSRLQRRSNVTPRDPL